MPSSFDPETIQLTIHRIGIYGEGISSLDGYTIFVDGALPGEVVTAKITQRKKNYALATPLYWHSYSPDRKSPPCPFFKSCGGCQIMHLDYQKQLLMKKQKVIDALERIGKLPSFKVNPCLPSPKQFAYRNKIQLPIVQGKEGLQLGFYAKRSHQLIPIKKCLIHGDLGESVYEYLQTALLKSSLTAWDPLTFQGELKHLLIKTAFHTQQALVIFIAAQKPSQALFHLAKQLIANVPQVKGVIHNLNKGLTNSILGKTYQTLAGLSSIEELLLGLKFKVSPASFFQVNPLQAKILYETVLNFLELHPKETLLDAYCGVGTLSLIAAKQAKEVIGVEAVQEAILDAKENCRLNQISNATFFAEPAEQWIQKTKKTIDSLVINPPRKGCEPQFLEGVYRLNPKKIVYVSCDPATLARDLHQLTAFNYSVKKIQPLDMFPQTTHVETVVQLTKNA